MSIQQAQLWLQKQSEHSLPAIRYNHKNIIDLLEHEHKSQDIVHCAAADPGLSLALLKKVNANRGGNSSLDSVDSVKSAIALLGDQVTHELLKEFNDAENILKKPHQLFLFQQIINRSYHYEIQVAEWTRVNGFQHIEQLKTSALLTYTGEALCCVYDFEKYLDFVKSGSVENTQQQFFGFSFAELTEALCLEFNLPQQVIDSLEHNNSHGQKEKFLLLIGKLCHQAEQGWYTDNQQVTFEQFAELLKQPVDQVICKFHTLSVQAAHQSIIPDAWQAASRLVLIQDKAWTPPAPPVTVKPELNKIPGPEKISPEIQKHKNSSTEEDIFTRIKKMLSQEKTVQSDLLNACLKGLVNDFSMSRVCLFLLSKDKTRLNNRLSHGFDKSAPFQQYEIEVSHAGLLKILLNKPQSIWINKSSFKKYQKIIPQTLLANIMTDDFLAMSLFIGDKPIGIIYADRNNANQPLTEQDFLQYKQLISLTSKALTFLSNKK